MHVGFVFFAVFGALAVARWPRLAWVHLPAVAWAGLVELAGWTCPLTPLEIRWLEPGLRRLRGLQRNDDRLVSERYERACRILERWTPRGGLS